MEDSHHNYIKNKYCNKAKILLTDTDNLIQKIEAENVYEHFCNKKFFDFRNHSADSKYYNNANNLIVRNMKDETFVGIKFKIYTFITIDSHESNI